MWPLQKTKFNLINLHFIIFTTFKVIVNNQSTTQCHEKNPKGFFFIQWQTTIEARIGWKEIYTMFSVFIGSHLPLLRCSQFLVENLAILNLFCLWWVLLESIRTNLQRKFEFFSFGSCFCATWIIPSHFHVLDFISNMISRCSRINQTEDWVFILSRVRVFAHDSFVHDWKKWRNLHFSLYKSQFPFSRKRLHLQLEISEKHFHHFSIKYRVSRGHVLVWGMCVEWRIFDFSNRRQTWQILN